MQELFHTKGLCGLVNLGNTCFLNSIVQCLNNNYEFLVDIYDQVGDKKDNNLLNEFVTLSKSMYTRNGVVSPNDFLKLIKSVAINKGNDEYASGNGQKCASEFLTFLLDALGTCYKKQINIDVKYEQYKRCDNDQKKMHSDAIKVYYAHFKKTYSNIVKHYYGQYINIVRKKDKEEISYQYDPYNIIQLPINPNNNTIDDCLKDFCSIEKLNDTTFRQVKFYSFPKILIIQFKRDIHGHKNNKLITFPLELDMSKYSVISNSKGNVNAEEQKFELISICNHFGDNRWGHYTTYSKNFNGNWYEFNDSNVYSASPKSIVTNCAYILFYKLKLSK